MNDLKLFTKLVNTYLSLDPLTPTRLHALQGKVMAVQLLPSGLTLFCRVHATGMLCQYQVAEREIIAEVTVQGTLLSLLSAALRRDKQSLFLSGELTILGNAELGQQFTALLSAGTIDWEACAMRLIGEVPAYYAGHLLRGLCQWQQQARQSVRQDIADYLHEETALLPPKNALADFFTEVDDLRAAVDRLIAKVTYLEKGC